MPLAATPPLSQDSPTSSNMVPDLLNSWHVIGCVLSTLLDRSSYSEDSFSKTSAAPSLAPFPIGYSSSTPPASDTSTAKFVPIIRSFIHSPFSVAFARNLRGEEAQGLIDVIDQAATIPELEEELRKQCLHLLYKMCKDCKTLPTSYTLQQGHLCAGVACSYGGFADVSKGDYLGRRVAIKRLRFWAEEAPSKVFKRFCREIIVWKRLSHPNVLPLLGVSFSTALYSFLMVSAWMQNGNVMEYARSNPNANRLELLSGVMSGASYLHGLGVIHGDLKGANILVDDDGTPLLADFGLAAVSVDLKTIPLSATIVSSGGTIPWMSPELLFGKNSLPSQESDIYALGMVIYEVLTGRTPFYYLPGFTMLVAVREGERPRKPVDARSLGFSDRLWGLVLQCWDESPSARPTAQDLLYCLQDISPAWTPPLVYPIPDGPNEEAGADSPFSR